ncbi:hypothetical protein G4D37_24700 [Burkholderia pseudomallei]|uniref:hypothetical protein n=1 Tax=Burkholderia pseudomallei TaxID=28450 RepID=UPI0015935203|nr:hypothetical protein [Burkholderia pseudomallei]NVH69336.1 hypothetical protein [Burkholderia pseudomallei]
MNTRNTLTESADQVGEASALLARYRALLAGAGSITAPVVAHAVNDLRRTATALECVAIALANAQRAPQGASE